MPTDWHDINEPGFAFSSRKEDSSVRPAEPEPSVEEQPDKEIEARLSEPEFLPGEGGFHFNEKCRLRVRIELLKKTIRKRVLFRLFSEYDGEVTDLSHEVEGFAKDGYAVAEATLHHDPKFYDAQFDKPEAVVRYFFRARHSRGEAEIESGRLEMPKKVSCRFVEMPDVLFHHNSAVPCVDADGMLTRALAATLEFAADNPDMEMVAFGHTDTSGEIAYNYELSELRARGVKALVNRDTDAWSDVCAQRSKVEDYQRILKTLAHSHGWPCDPGAVDNAAGPRTQSGVKKFQEEYNRRFNQSIVVDGVVGRRTWKAIGEVLCDLVCKGFEAATGRSEFPELSYGYGGKGIFACGESFPIDPERRGEYRSKTDRRVEVVFWDKTCAPKLQEPVSRNMKLFPHQCPVYHKVRGVRSPLEPGADAGLRQLEFLDENDRPVEGIVVRRSDGNEIPVPGGRADLGGNEGPLEVELGGVDMNYQPGEMPTYA